MVRRAGEKPDRSLWGQAQKVEMGSLGVSERFVRSISYATRSPIIMAARVVKVVLPNNGSVYFATRKTEKNRMGPQRSKLPPWLP